MNEDELWELLANAYEEIPKETALVYLVLRWIDHRETILRRLDPANKSGRYSSTDKEISHYLARELSGEENIFSWINHHGLSEQIKISPRKINPFRPRAHLYARANKKIARYSLYIEADFLIETESCRKALLAEMYREEIPSAHRQPDFFELIKQVNSQTLVKALAQQKIITQKILAGFQPDSE